MICRGLTPISGPSFIYFQKLIQNHCRKEIVPFKRKSSLNIVFNLKSLKNIASINPGSFHFRTLKIIDLVQTLADG